MADTVMLLILQREVQSYKKFVRWQEWLWVIKSDMSGSCVIIWNRLDYLFEAKNNLSNFVVYKDGEVFRTLSNI